MRILSFNTYRGGIDKGFSRIPFIKEVILELRPDFLALQEANNFEKEDYKLFKEIGNYCGLKYCALSLGSRTASGTAYHVASYLRYHIKEIEDFRGKFRNAALQTVIQSDIGEVSICNTHLTPVSEKDRLDEIGCILDSMKAYDNRIILGDLNSLSEQDGLEDSLIEKFNETQIKKFSENGKLKFDVIRKIIDNGYIDVAVKFGSNNINTVPTESNIDSAHEVALRLDYAFVSKNLADYVKDFCVARSEISERASDHYPIFFVLGR